MSESIALNIDCMEYMATLPDKAFDLAIVDPPYGDAGGVGRTSPSEYENQARTTKPEWNRFGQRFDRYKTSNPERGGAEVSRTGGTWAAKYGKKIIAWDIAPEKEYFNELFRVSRNQIIWGGNYFELPPTRCFLVWRKTNIPLEDFSMSPCEYAWTSFSENCRVFEHTSIRDATSGKFHPTEKPIALYQWILKHYAKNGDRILDTHLGSGSSRIAAYNLGFDFVGCEIDKEYFDKQEERFARHTAQTSLFVEGFDEQSLF